MNYKKKFDSYITTRSFDVQVEERDEDKLEYLEDGSHPWVEEPPTKWIQAEDKITLVRSLLDGKKIRYKADPEGIYFERKGCWVTYQDHTGSSLGMVISIIWDGDVDFNEFEIEVEE